MNNSASCAHVQLSRSPHKLEFRTHFTFLFWNGKKNPREFKKLAQSYCFFVYPERIVLRHCRCLGRRRCLSRDLFVRVSTTGRTNERERVSFRQENEIAVVILPRVFVRTA